LDIQFDYKNLEDNSEFGIVCKFIFQISISRDHENTFHTSTIPYFNPLWLCLYHQHFLNTSSLAPYKHLHQKLPEKLDHNTQLQINKEG